MVPSSLLIIDDNKGVLESLELLLESEFESVETLDNPNRLPSVLQESIFQVYLLDMNFSGAVQTGNEGFYWMDRILELDPDAVIVFITAYGDIELAVRAVKKGAFDFITKPWDNNQLLTTLQAAVRFRQSKDEVKKLKTQESSLERDLSKNFPLVKGDSPAMLQVYRILDKVAPTDADILILGENGTGKEVIAREIHRKSQRSKEIFLSVDIASISEGIIESELFGHKKGAFTDAKEDRTGRFEAAMGGTLFLDEIGNLSMATQAKLLSALQTRQIVPVGSNRPVEVDIRLICATNAELKAKIHQGSFREDLYYRINTVTLNIPPLRERKEDIPPLLEYYIDVFGRKYGKPGLRLNSAVKKRFLDYPWKGNVRELRHAVERAVIFSGSGSITEVDLQLRDESLPARNGTEEQVIPLEELEKEAIIKAIEIQKGNMTLVAAALGITRQTLYNKIRKYGL
jgi:DNA-binding NtrC family response regulator